MLVIVANNYEFNHASGRGAQEPYSPTVRDLFTSASLICLSLWHKDCLILLPKQPSVEFLEYVEQKWEIVPQTLAPTTPSAWVSEEFISDGSGCPFVSDSGMATTISWGYTQKFAKLCEHRGWHDTWRVGSAQRQNLAALIAELDSKIGSSTLLDHLTRQDVTLARKPPWIWVDAGAQDALPRIQDALQRWGSVILKPNRSWGGRETFLLSTRAQLEAVPALLATMASARWSDSKIVVECFVGNTGNTYSPSIDVVTDVHGAVERWIPCQMTMSAFKTAGLKYTGSIGSEICARMRALAELCATYLRSHGYCGWFDLDFVVAEDVLWVTEINVRMTGATVPIRVMDATHGPDWSTRMQCVCRDAISCAVGLDPLRIAESMTGPESGGRSGRVDISVTNLDVLEDGRNIFSFVISAPFGIDIERIERELIHLVTTPTTNALPT